MAYWLRKGKGNQVYVYTYLEGRHMPLARSLTRHLDGEPDHNIKYWVKQYELTHEGPRRDLANTLADVHLTDLVEKYCQYMTTSRGRSKSTVADHRRYLLEYAVPFFLGYNLHDPNQWPARSFELHDHLAGTCNLTKFQIEKCHTSLRMFWRFLRARRLLVAGQQQDLDLMNPLRSSSPTPLGITLTPEQALEFSRRTSDPEIALMTLLGYFCSLRPGELFALRRGDFIAGVNATKLEACKVMASYSHFGKLAVNITKQRRNDGTLSIPKANSKGIVACFSRGAAELIVSHLNKFPPDKLLFSSGLPDWMYVKWRRSGIKGVTLKDLRRSSLYWLGHYGSLEFTALRNHARHSLPETTVLYLRRPEEAFDAAELDQLDLEA